MDKAIRGGRIVTVQAKPLIGAEVQQQSTVGSVLFFNFIARSSPQTDFHEANGSWPLQR
jgi:hypothetical protein